MATLLQSMELCAGAGGLALGLEKAGFKNILCLDKDSNACKTLQLNTTWNVICDSLENFLSKTAFKKYQNLHLLSAGLPCQSFSEAGLKKGIKDERGQLFFVFFEIIKKIKPQAFLIENVQGLISKDQKNTFELFLKIIKEELNYHVTWKVLNAWDYNVAQKRKRIFIIAFRKKAMFKNFLWPAPITPRKTLKDVLKNVPISDGLKYPPEKKKILDLVPPGGCWINLPEELAKLYMKKSYYLGGGRRGIARRMAWTEPSLTLTTSPMQKQTERCHPEVTRPFSVREYARIQSFPDNWYFHGSLHSQYRQIGNAVPVNLAKAIGLSIFKALKNEK